MYKDFQSYSRLFANRDFFILTSTLFLGQVASAFLLLSLITSVFQKTQSNFGVSGVILSLSIPALILIAPAGLVADLVDRKKIILIVNFFITLCVIGIILTLSNVASTLILSFLYFAGNSFFLPAVSAASGQLSPKKDLNYANSIFFLTLTGGQVIGMFFASIVQFFFGHFSLLFVSSAFLIICIFLPMLLPKLLPDKSKMESIFSKLADIWQGFRYVFRAKTIWFYFLIFGFLQGVVAFSATLTPGFFDRVLSLPITKSPLFVFPPLAVGLFSGAIFSHRPKIRSSTFVVIGTGITGFASGIFALIIAANFLEKWLFLPAFIFLVSCGFGVILCMIAARTVLQRRIDHKYQGTVFGANFFMQSALATVLSPMGAFMVVAFGYVNVLFLLSLGFLASSAIVSLMSKKWNF